MAATSVGEERADVIKLRKALKDSVLKVKEFRGDTWVCLRREKIREAITLLKEDPELQYSYFVECLGADYSTWKEERDLPERFEVIYNLYSLLHLQRIFLKVGVDDGQRVPSIKDIFLGAEYPEREIWDMYGIVFEGNEQTQRFLMPDDWVGFPLRKDFPLGGEDVLFDKGERGPAIEDRPMPHAGESFEGKTGTEDVSGR